MRFKFPQYHDGKTTQKPLPTTTSTTLNTNNRENAVPIISIGTILYINHPFKNYITQLSPTNTIYQ